MGQIVLSRSTKLVCTLDQQESRAAEVSPQDCSRCFTYGSINLTERTVTEKIGGFECFAVRSNKRGAKRDGVHSANYISEFSDPIRVIERAGGTCGDDKMGAHRGNGSNNQPE